MTQFIQQAKCVMMSPMSTSADYALRLGYHTEVPPKPDFFNVGAGEVFHY